MLDLSMFSDSRPLSQQIAGRLRQGILDGSIAHGTSLPPARRLASELNTSPFTVHTALTTLVREGLLERKPRRGTIVRAPADRLMCVGLYYGRDLWRNEAMASYRQLHRALLDALSAANIRHHAWVDMRSEAEQESVFPEVQQAIRLRRIQGLIVGVATPADAIWLRSLPLPRSVYGSVDIPGRVTGDLRHQWDLAMGSLRRRGCRSVGLIAPVPSGRIVSTASPEAREFYPTFIEGAARNGLETCEDWIRHPDYALDGAGYEGYGYEQFRQLWALSRRPDGLVVYPDILARGVVTAALELRVAVPDELELVLHRNREIPFVCPLPAAWLVNSLDAVARALIRQVQVQVAGEPVRPFHVPQELEEPGPPA